MSLKCEPASVPQHIHVYLEVVLGAVVLELDVEAVLDAHLHLDRVVDLGRWLPTQSL